MKYLIAILLLACVGQVASAQTTASAREVALTPKGASLGAKKSELDRFSTHLSRLRMACTSRNASETAVYESALLTAMRQAMEERTMKPLPLPSATRDLERMQEIFSTYIKHTSFDAATPAVADAKFALLDDFQRLLQSQYDSLK